MLLLLCLPAFSQINLGRISGSITDQTGGAIAGATVTIVDVARGVSRPLMTDDSGQYSAPSLTPGDYVVRVEAMGFRALERKDIVVTVGGDARVDLVLQPGAQSETVIITGELPMINTSNAVLGGALENKIVQEIPLSGRSYMNLLDYRPGFTSGAGGAASGRRSNGMRADSNNWMVDGLYSGDIYNGYSVTNGFSIAVGPDPSSTLPLDAIQDVNVQSNPKSEFGYKPGATDATSVTSTVRGVVGIETCADGTWRLLGQGHYGRSLHGPGRRSASARTAQAARAIDMSVLSRESISKYQGSQALLGAVPDRRLAMALQYSQTGKFERATRPVRPSVPEWMIQTTADHLARLQELLAKSPLNRLQRTSAFNGS